MSHESTVRRPKVDPADGEDASETFLPGQIPVRDAESRESDRARATEQQPNAAEAAQAVNPEFLSGIDANSPLDNPEIAPVEDRNKGER